jgi:LacI family transcriptional regulator
MESLNAAIARRVRATRNERLTLTVVQYHALDPSALVARLDALGTHEADCAVVVAPDDPAVARAIDAVTRRGVAVLTLVSDLPGSARRQFIGIDNQAAGRSAASLLGRFCASGKVGIIAGSLGLRAGTLDVVLDQNPDGEIRAAIAAARQVALSPDAEIHSDPIEIGIFLRDNLR